MYLISAMMAILLWSSISKTFFLPSLWTLEMAQFHHGGVLPARRAPIRCSKATTCAWIFAVRHLVAAYANVGGCLHDRVLDRLSGAAAVRRHFQQPTTPCKYGERSHTAWQPYMAPIKIVACVGIVLYAGCRRSPCCAATSPPSRASSCDELRTDRAADVRVDDGDAAHRPARLRGHRRRRPPSRRCCCGATAAAKWPFRPP